MIIYGNFYDLEVVQSEVTNITEASVMLAGHLTEALDTPEWHLSGTHPIEVLFAATEAWERLESAAEEADKVRLHLV